VGLSEVVGQAAVRDRTATHTKAKSLDKIVIELGEAGRKLLLPESDSVKNLVRGSASVLPLTWLFMRIEERQSDTGWDAELKAKTGVLSVRELTPGEFAIQVFAERQAQRVYQSLVKG